MFWRLRMTLPANQESDIIGGGGGDYTTLAAWEADLDYGIWSQDYYGKIFDLTADNDAIYFSSIENGGYDLKIYPNTGAEADGSDSSGAQVDSHIYISEPDSALLFYFDGILFHTSGGIHCGQENTSSITYITKCVFRDVIIDCISPVSCDDISVNVGVCLFRNAAETYCYGIDVNDADLISNVVVLNCTAYDMYGGYDESAGIFTDLRNCVAMDSQTDNDFQSSPSNITYCCSSDTSATGTGSIIEKTSANNFTNAGGDDFTVKDTNADIYHSGQLIEGESWFPATDLAGTTWNMLHFTEIMILRKQ